MASPPDDDLYEAIREQYPPVLTTAQVGELLHIGARTVLTMALDGRLRASRLPGTRQYNFFRDDVIRVFDQNMCAPARSTSTSGGGGCARPGTGEEEGGQADPLTTSGPGPASARPTPAGSTSVVVANQRVGDSSVM